MDEELTRGKEAWKRQRLFKKDNIVSVSPEKMLEITQGIENLTLRALVALLYVTGCRISELIRYEKLFFEREEYIDKKTGKKRKRVIWTTRKVVDSAPSIKKNQMQYKEADGKFCLLITVRNLKNREHHEKSIPVNSLRPINREFLNIIEAYNDTLGPDDELFPYNRSQIEYKLKKLLPFNIHYIRDIRATHLYVLYDLKEEELKRAMGWTDTRPADRYVNMKWSDFAHKT